MKRRTGRNTKLTPELQEKLCGFISEGLTIQSAAACCGVSVPTITRWRADQRPIYKRFRVAFEQAQGLFLSRLEEEASRFAQPHTVTTEREIIHPKTGEVVTLKETRHNVVEPSLLRFMLERRFPAEYGDSKDVTLKAAEDSSPFEINIMGTIMGQGTAAEATEEQQNHT